MSLTTALSLSYCAILSECNCVFLHAILWNCSHSATVIATAICVYMYRLIYITITHRTSQSHKMGLEPIHVWHFTKKSIPVTPCEQYHCHPHNILHATIKRNRIHKKSHCVNEPSGVFKRCDSDFDNFLKVWKFSLISMHPRSILKIKSMEFSLDETGIYWIQRIW